MAGSVATARWRIEAIASGDERFGNLTITVTPGGEVSIRLPRPLEHLANAPRCRYVLSGRAKYSYRGDEWLVRITGHRPVSYTRRHSISAIAVEDLNFADARTTGRETMGRGRRGRRFRKTVAGIPTAVFRNRLTAQACRGDIQLYAVNPAYTSAWGDQHWRNPYENVTRHEAAATVIGRRAQGHKARRREGVTRARPEDRAVRATGQTHQ
ncbi:MAG TPA: hypothetical protein VGG54_31235 [Trebonia sp.]